MAEMCSHCAFVHWLVSVLEEAQDGSCNNDSVIKVSACNAILYCNDCTHHHASLPHCTCRSPLASNANLSQTNAWLHLEVEGKTILPKNTVLIRVM